MDIFGDLKMTYNNPRTVFQERVNNILKNEAKNSNLFEDIFKLQNLLSLEKVVAGVPRDDPDQWRVLMELFSTFGSVQFARIISIMKGKTVTFPTEEEYQDSIITVLCYYYKEIEGFTWDKIKEKLNSSRLNTIKYGIRVRQLKGFIDSQLLKKLTKKVK
jgi:hypothetical protein